jgi:Zn-dependent M28 family amino/carboxypeptidase
VPAEHPFYEVSPPLTAREQQTRARLRRDVEMLSEVLGPRNWKHHGALEASARFIEDRLTSLGFSPTAQRYKVFGKEVRNIIAEIPGHHPRAGRDIFLLGAHYDSVECPAANDNASGVAGVLEAAHRFAGNSFRRTVRLVFFVNEEPPFYKGNDMGSLRYARLCRQNHERIRGLVNLETVGCYYAGEGSQHYPEHPWIDKARRFLPKQGNFVVFTGDFRSARLTFALYRRFKKHTRFPALWFPSPRSVMGPDMSDHWSFWQVGYPGVMVTDTAFMRYPHYHTQNDLPSKMNFDAMTRVTAATIESLADLAGR